jgi:hypothetical protein
MMSRKDWLNLGVALLGPLAAVILTLVLTPQWEHQKERRERQLSLFRTLMTTRTASVRQSEALNVIDMDFDGPEPAEGDVRNAWHEYLASLRETGTPETVVRRREDRYIDLLYAMTKALGYHIERPALHTQFYVANAVVTDEAEERAMRKAALEMLTGGRVLFVAPGKPIQQPTGSPVPTLPPPLAGLPDAKSQEPGPLAPLSASTQ